MPDQNLRGSGRTHSQLVAISEDQAIFLVHNHPMRSHALDILSRIGREGVTVRIISDNWSFHQLRGNKLPVYADHALLERMPQELYAMLLALPTYRAFRDTPEPAKTKTRAKKKTTNATRPIRHRNNPAGRK